MNGFPSIADDACEVGYHYKTALAVLGEVRPLLIFMSRGDNFQCSWSNRLDSKLVKVAISPGKNGVRDK
jgi:hypothetical protein